MQLESLILSLIIDAKEGRDVATADTVGEYLLANMKDYVLVKLTGKSVDIMCGVSAEYEKYVGIENGKRVLYLRLKKELYGCMQSAILWYDTIKGCLEELGFKVNAYDRCVANKTINGKQCTICWYADDTKISHVDPKVVDDVIKTIEKRFDKMTVKRGRTHNFVGMNLTFKDNGTVEILMQEYIRECMESFDEEMKKANTPAKHNLFDVNDIKQMSEIRMEIFHHIVAKLLYVSKRARVDIDLAVSFLCTRVSRSTEED